MHNIYAIQTQKTYMGKTAGGWLKNAIICRMSAGNVEVITDDLPGAILVLSDSGNMVITNIDRAVSLTTSSRAYNILKKLTSTANRQMLQA